AAPYAIEEFVAGDVEGLHVTVGPPTPGGPRTIVATDRAAFAAWLQRFGPPAQWPPSVVPEVLALPWTDRTWTLGVDGERLVLRTADARGLGLSCANLEGHLHAVASGLAERPEEVLLQGGPAAQHERAGEALRTVGLPARALPDTDYLVACARGCAAGGWV